jgi:hypothetical protein
MVTLTILAGHGKDGHGLAWPGTAGTGWAGQGQARHGRARRGYFQEEGPMARKPTNTNYHHRRAQGLCGYAGCPHHSERAYCPAHERYYAEASRKMRADRVAAGRCAYCGGERSADRKLCHSCRQYLRIMRQQREERRCAA